MPILFQITAAMFSNVLFQNVKDEFIDTVIHISGSVFVQPIELVWIFDQPNLNIRLL